MEIKKQRPLVRGAGTLLAISSLPAPYGIGSFSRAAYDFVDFLHKSGQRYWQVLPLCPTSFGDSPYQSFSAFAGNPYFIDLDALIAEGLLTTEEVQGVFWGDTANEVDYSAIYSNRFTILKRAFSRSNFRERDEYWGFCSKHSEWLEDYTLFMAIKDSLGGLSWSLWPQELRMRESYALERARAELSVDIEFWRFCQFYFYRQWELLKDYANSRGIMIIGDMPIYVAEDSADVWSNHELFQLDDNRMPTHVAGVSPDMFSETGQLWGNPLYDWDEMARTNYIWWRKRMRLYAELYDIIRIDHFIGITHYYSIPAGESTAMNGRWLPGPGEKLIAAISEELEGKQIIAEDLGPENPMSVALRKKAGYPGMKLYQMAFDTGGGNGNLPGYYDMDTIAYGGTHDNETLLGFLTGQSSQVLSFAREYLNENTESDIPWAMIRTAYASSAAAVIFQMQDYLVLDNSARMNTPSTVGDNWKWRLKNGQITDELIRRLKRFGELYGR